MGGTATIQQMLAVSSLVAAPHVLDALNWVPCAGALIGLLAWIWGVIIYIKATMVANRMTAVPAFLAVFLPILIPAVLLLGFLFFVVLLAAIGN